MRQPDATFQEFHFGKPIGKKFYVFDLGAVWLKTFDKSDGDKYQNVKNVKDIHSTNLQGHFLNKKSSNYKTMKDIEKFYKQDGILKVENKMKKSELRQIIKEEIQKILETENWTSNSNNKWFQDAQLFDFVKRKLKLNSKKDSIYKYEYNGKSVDEKTFLKLVDKVAVHNNKFLHANWKDSARSYFFKKMQ